MPWALVRGFPVVGRIPPSGIFAPAATPEVDEDVVGEFLRSAPAWNAELASRPAPSADPQVLKHAAQSHGICCSLVGGVKLSLPRAERYRLL